MISPTPQAPITISGHGKAAPVRAQMVQSSAMTSV